MAWQGAISQYNGSASYNLTPRNPAGILGGDQIFVDHLSKLRGQRDKHYCTVCFPRAFNYKDSWESIQSIQPIWRIFLKKFITPWSVSHRPPKKEPPDPLHWDPGGSSPSQVGSKSAGIEIVQKDAKGSPSAGRILIKNGFWQRNVFIISSRAHFWRFDSFGKHHILRRANQIRPTVRLPPFKARAPQQASIAAPNRHGMVVRDQGSPNRVRLWLD